MESTAKDPTIQTAVRKDLKKDHKPRRKRGRTIQVKDIVQLLWSRKFIVLFFFVAVVSVTLIYTVKSPKVYRATAKLEIENETIDLFQSGSAFTIDTSSRDYFRTQCSKIKSRKVAGNVIAMRRFKVTDPKTREERLMHPLELRRKLKVEPERDTRLVNISVEDTDPKQAMEMANAVAEEFIKFNVDTKLKARTAYAQAIERQLDDLTSQIGDAQRQFTEFQKRRGVFSIKDDENIVLAKVAIATKAVTDAEAEVAAAQIAYDRIKNLPLEELKKQPEIEDDSVIKQRKADLGRAETDLSLASQHYGPKHPVYQDKELAVQETKKSIDGRAEAVRELLNERLDAATKKKQKADQDLKETETAAQEFNTNIRPTYENLQRVVEKKTKVYEEVLLRGTEGSVETGVSRAPTQWEAGTSNIRIVDEAILPRVPIRPRPLVNMALAVFIGLALGCGSAFTMEYLNDKVKNPDHITEDLGMTLLAMIPKPKRRLASAREMARIVANHPRWHVSEAYRNLRTNIRLMARDGRFPSLLVTSACPGEGKTTTAENLAIVVAQHGHSVLLLDTDMRRPRIRRDFEIDNSGGLFKYLAGECSLDDVLVNVSEAVNIEESVGGTPDVGKGQLWVLPCERRLPNPTEIISSPKMGHLIAELKKRFDVIIFDSPPCQFSDPLLLARYADGVVAVIEALHYDKRTVAQGLEHLDRLEEHKVLGAVLNKYDWKKSGGYGYYGYRSYYYYRYYDRYYYDYYSRSGKTTRRSRSTTKSARANRKSKAASPSGDSTAKKNV